MKKILIAVIAVTLTAGAIAQKVEKKKFPAGYKYKTECIGTDLDGNPIMRSWGSANSKKDAVRKAYQTALDHIIFENTRGNTNDCNLIPLVVEANADEEYARYFKRLLYTGKGGYMKYMDKKDDKVKVYKDKKDDEFLARVEVTVKRRELKKKLTRKDIIEKYKKEKKLYK